MTENIIYTKYCQKCGKQFHCEPFNRYYSDKPNEKTTVTCTMGSQFAKCVCDPCFHKQGILGHVMCRTVYLNQKPRKGKLIGGVPIQ